MRLKSRSWRARNYYGMTDSAYGKWKVRLRGSSRQGKGTAKRCVEQLRYQNYWNLVVTDVRISWVLLLYSISRPKSIWIAWRAFTTMITMTDFNEITIHIFDARFHNLSEELKTKASSMGAMSADYK